MQDPSDAGDIEITGSDGNDEIAVTIGYGDRLTEDGTIEHFASLQIAARNDRDEGFQLMMELTPERLASLLSDVTRVSEAIAAAKRREAIRTSRIG